MQVGGVDAGRLRHEGEESVDDGQHTDDGDKVEPKPENNVDLFVDNVDGQDTHRIVLLHVTGCTIAMECTLG